MDEDRDLTQASPTGADPDAWDAKPADEENAPRDDADRAARRGVSGEDVGETEGGAGDRDHEDRIPGVPKERTADRTEGGAGRP